MDEKRKGEIAYLAVKHIARERGLQNLQEYMRIDTAASRLGISHGEFCKFVELVIEDLVKEALRK